MFNSDDVKYGGTGAVNAAPCKVEWKPSHGQESSVAIRIPPFGAVFLRGQGKLRPKPKAQAKRPEKPAAKKATVKKTAKGDAPAASAPARTARAAAKKAAPSATEKKPAARRGKKATSAAE